MATDGFLTTTVEMDPSSTTEFIDIKIKCPPEWERDVWIFAYAPAFLICVG